MQYSSNREFGYVMGTLLFPVFFLPYAIRNIRRRRGEICLIMFITFFGYQLIFQPKGFEVGAGADCARYAVLFAETAQLQGISFSEYFAQLGFHDNVDYFNPILLYVVSRFTRNTHVYFMIYAFIFALFYVNNLGLVLSQCKNRTDAYWVILFVAFSLIISINDFGGIRMPMAFQVFLWGVLNFFYKKRKWSIVWIVVSLWIHFSMFILVLAFFGFGVVRKLRIRAFYMFFIIAHVFSAINVDFVQSLFSFLPGGIESRLMLYTNEANMEQYESGGKYYLGEMNLWGRLDSIVFRTYVLVVYLYIWIRGVSVDSRYELLLKFSIYIYGVALLLSNLPSGYRFILPAAFLCFSTVLVLLNNSYPFKKVMARANKIMAPLLLVLIAHRFRFILDEVGLSVFYTNFITMYFIDDNVPILMAIKDII